MVVRDISLRAASQEAERVVYFEESAWVLGNTMRSTPVIREPWEPRPNSRNSRLARFLTTAFPSRLLTTIPILEYAEWVWKESKLNRGVLSLFPYCLTLSKSGFFLRNNPGEVFWPLFIRNRQAMSSFFPTSGYYLSSIFRTHSLTKSVISFSF